MKKRLWLLGFSILFCTNALSQHKDQKKVKILPVPAFGYSPETNTYLGFVSLFTIRLNLDTTTRSSAAKLEFNYTWNKQIIAESSWTYFFKEEQWMSIGQIHYSFYPDLYYGIGTHAKATDECPFDSKRFALESQFLKRIKPAVFAGIKLKWVDYNDVKTRLFSMPFSELKAASVAGIGVSLVKDKRNRILTPTEGAYISINTNVSKSVSFFYESTLDMRIYRTFKKKYTLAGRFLNDFNFGELPFFDYALLGGDKTARGYYYGRFRDKHMSTLQGEYRMPLFWRFGMAAFGGVSQVYPSVDQLAWNSLKYNGGLGLRFLVDKNEMTSLRLDYALGNNKNHGFYVSFGESF